jgi:Acyl-CoA dehydrogenase, C-terminal domain
VGKESIIETTALKVAASELCNKCADSGIQILGGMGYSAETDMQRYWRDSRLRRIGPVYYTHLLTLCCSFAERALDTATRIR